MHVEVPVELCLAQPLRPVRVTTTLNWFVLVLGYDLIYHGVWY